MIFQITLEDYNLKAIFREEKINLGKKIYEYWCYCEHREKYAILSLISLSVILL